MNSFYGGLTGQHFKFSAIFPSRVALKEDLKQTMYSPIGLDEFVLVSYGIQNLTPYPDGESDTVSYIVNTIEGYSESSTQPIKQETIVELNNYYNNRAIDINDYGRSFNSTLWQKVYKSDLTPDEKNKNIIWYKNNYITISDIEDGENNYITAKIKDDNIREIEQNLDYCYICLGSFTGTMPIIEVKSESLAPANKPTVSIDNTNIDKPIMTFGLPEAVEIFWDIEIENEEDGKPVLDEGIPQLKNNIEYPDTIKAGDYIVSKYDYIYLYNKKENETPILEYKGTFIPTFNQQNKILNAFDNNGQPNQISIDLIQNGHKDYTFATKVPRIPEITVEVTESPVVGTETEPEMAEPSILTTKNENSLHFNFGIPQAIPMKHKWNGTKLILTSANGTTETELGTKYEWIGEDETTLKITPPNGDIIEQNLKGAKGDTGTPTIKYWLAVTAITGNYQEDILKAIEGYEINNQELIYITYITLDNVEQGYIVINPSGVEGYKIVPTSGGSGSGVWEELE